MKNQSNSQFLSPGKILLIDGRASVQFASNRILFRLVRALNYPTYYGWIWLEGYQLDAKYEAVEKRSIFVQIGGLRVINK